jgi:thiol-disulfide isomerase/thioredoxin
MSMSFLNPISIRLGCVIALTAAAFSLAAAPVKVGDTFPDLSKFKLEGALPDLKGKVVLVDFWASWCAPCKESFPTMNDLQKRYGTQGLVIIGINVDENNSDMVDFLKKHSASFTVVRDAAQKLVDKVDISTMPTSFLIDGSGKVRFTHSGFRGDETKKKYEQEIESLLQKQH